MKPEKQFYEDVLFYEGDIVYYNGEYDNCHNVKYKVVKIYRTIFGAPKWADIEALDNDILNKHYPYIYSALLSELKLIK